MDYGESMIDVALLCLALGNLTVSNSLSLYETMPTLQTNAGVFRVSQKQWTTGRVERLLQNMQQGVSKPVVGEQPISVSKLTQSSTRKSNGVAYRHNHTKFCGQFTESAEWAMRSVWDYKPRQIGLAHGPLPQDQEDSRNVVRKLQPSLGVRERQPTNIVKVGGVSTFQDVALTCLAWNIYFEARSEPFEGQVAVAEVNIRRSRLTGKPVCVETFREDQFTWTNQRNPKVVEGWAWSQAQHAANEAYVFDTDYSHGATHFHADYVSPRWAKKLCVTTKIGRHIFYKECG